MDALQQPSRTPLAAALRACRTGFIAAGLFSGVINLLVLTVSVYTIQVFDRVLSSRSLDTLVYLSVIAGAALLLMALLDGLRSRLLVRCSTWLEQALAPEAFGRAVEASVRGAPYAGQALRDLGQVRGFLGGAPMFALFDAPWVPVYLAAIFLLHSALGWLALGGAVLLFLLALLNEVLTRGALERANVLVLRAQHATEAGLRNAEVVDAMGMLPALRRRWALDNDRVIALQQGASDRSATVMALTKFLRMGAQVAVLGAGAYLVMNQQLSSGAMMAASIILGRAFAPVEQALGGWRQLVAARQAHARLHGFFAAPRLRHEGMALPAPRGALAVEQASFVFPGSARATLSRVGFVLGAGESLAVVGPSASGKTTLSRLLVGTLAPRAGAVRLDGAEIFSWPREDFARHVGYLPQDVELFAGTVRENIARLGEGEAEAVVEAARLAGCHEMILRLPQGYETEIGEAGTFLSGGQRQQVALARALFGGPRLVVLDEPNASLDADGERALVAALVHLRQRGTTVVVISHKPSLVHQVDKVLVLREGQVEAFGARAAVLEKLGRRGASPAEDHPVGRLQQRTAQRLVAQS